MSDTANEVQLVERAEAESSPTVKAALAVSVIDQVSRDTAGEYLQELKRAKRLVVDIFADPKRTAKAAHASICAAERRVLGPLEEADSHLRQGVAFYSEQEERKRQEAERKECERIEAEAEAERTRRLEEALEEGNEEEAESILEAPASSFEPPPLPTKRKPPPGPVGTQTRWKGECFDLTALVRAVASKNAPVELLSISQVALDAYARNHKESADLPGVTFRAYTSTVVR